MKLENDLPLNHSKNLGNKIINLEYRNNGGSDRSNEKNEAAKSSFSNADSVSLRNKLNFESDFKSIKDIERDMENTINSIMDNSNFARNFVHNPLNSYRVEALLGL